MTYKKERGMGMELKIPENFFVGAAMSGPQTEGAYKTGGLRPSGKYLGYLVRSFNF